MDDGSTRHQPRGGARHARRGYGDVRRDCRGAAAGGRRPSSEEGDPGHLRWERHQQPRVGRGAAAAHSGERGAGVRAWRGRRGGDPPRRSDDPTAHSDAVPVSRPRPQASPPAHYRRRRGARADCGARECRRLAADHGRHRRPHRDRPWLRRSRRRDGPDRRRTRQAVLPRLREPRKRRTGDGTRSGSTSRTAA